MSQRDRESGFALVSVVVLAALIAMVAAGLLSLVRRVSTAEILAVGEIELRAALEAGLTRAVLAYSRPNDSLRAALTPDGQKVLWRFDNKIVVIQVQAESGKVDLNAAKRDMVTSVIARLPFSPPTVAHFLARLAQARSERHRLTSVEGLLDPLARLTEQRDIAKAHFTVMTGQPGVDPTTTPRLILESIPGLSKQAIAAILAARANNRPIPMAGISAATTASFVSQRPVYAIRAETADGFRRAGAMSAIVGFSAGGNIAIYSWAPAAIWQ